MLGGRRGCCDEGRERNGGGGRGHESLCLRSPPLCIQISVLSIFMSPPGLGSTKQKGYIVNPIPCLIDTQSTIFFSGRTISGNNKYRFLCISVVWHYSNMIELNQEYNPYPKNF
jgi:hypothetical protein